MARSKSKKSKTSRELNAVCMKVRALLVKAERNDIQARFKVAGIVKGVMSSAKYGEKALEQMEATIGLDMGSLYRMAAVPRVWAPADFKELASRKNKKGIPLTWSHLELLANEVKDGRTRNSLMIQTLNENLSIRALRALVKNPDQTEPKSSAAKAMPPTDAEVIADLNGFVETIEAKITTWGNRLAGDVGVAHLKMQPTEVNMLRETLARMTKTAENMKNLADQILVVINACGKPMADVHELKPVVQPVLTPATAAL